MTDPHLAAAVVAALASVGWEPRPQTDPAALDGRDWDVCVAESGFAGAALEARRGRGLVLLTAAPTPPPRTGARAVVRLCIPCPLAPLREAVRAAAAAAQAGEGPGIAS